MSMMLKLLTLSAKLHKKIRKVIIINLNYLGKILVIMGCHLNLQRRLALFVN